MSKTLLSIVVLGSVLAATQANANASEHYSSSSVSTSVISTNYNTVINNQYYYSNNRKSYRYGYYNKFRNHAPSNQIQFRVPVRLNIFGSNIDININSHNYPIYRR